MPRIINKLVPKISKIKYKSIEDNEGKHKCKSASLNYIRDYYSLNDIQSETQENLATLRKLGRSGWASISVNYGDKWFSTPLNISFKTKNVNVRDLIFSYFDDFFSGDAKNPFTNDPNEDVFKSFHINLTTITKKGKADEDKNCFYHRISELGNTTFDEPSFMYHYLKVPYNSAITSKQAIGMQKKCKYNIIISGEATYEPVEPNPLYPTYRLTVLGNHWSHTETLEEKEDRYKHNFEKPMLFVKEDGEYKIIYNKETTNPEYEVDIENRKKTSHFHSIQVKDWKEAEQIMKEYKEILEHSKGKWNLFKTGKIVDTIRRYVKEKMKIYDVEPIGQLEAKFIERASRRPHCDCKPGVFENVHYYDIKKAYASHLNSMFFKIPIKKGKLITYTQKECDEIVSKKFKFIYGIYKAIVGGEDNRFVYNPKNYYTHTDLNCAIDLGLPIKIREKEGNAFIYSCKDCCISCAHIFRPLINDWYEMSKVFPNNKTVKILLSSIWGSVSQQKRTWRYLNDENEATMLKNHVVSNIEQNENGTRVGMTNYLSPYYCNLARLKPFILARQRETMIDYIKDIYDEIVYIRTDGIYSTKKLEFQSEGDIGSMLFKKTFEKIEIKNCNDIKIIL